MNEITKEIPLTEEQRQLAADNHNLIYSYANKNGLHLDKYYDILAIALCHAAQSFDPSKGYTFSTYAYRAMENEKIRYWRLNSRGRCVPEEMICSLQTLMRNTHSRDKDLEETLIWNEAAQSIDTSSIEVSEFLDTLNEKQRAIALYLCEGLTNKQIGKIYGVSGSYIGTIKKKIIQRYYIFDNRHDLAYMMRNTGKMIRDGKWGKK